MKADFQRQAHDSSAVQEWRTGWPVVLSGAIGYGTGAAMILLLASLFIKPMRDALGWSTSAVTIAPIITLVWALNYPLAGAAIDRFGSRRVAIVGSLGLAASALLMASLPISRFGFYGTATLIGLFCSMTSVPTYTRGIASWFSSSVGLAFGVVLSGSALVAVSATPLTGMTIHAYGWRAGYLTLAGIILLIGLPAILLGFRERPGTIHSGDAEAPAAGKSVGEVLRDARFWCYLTAFSTACVALGGFLGHLQPLLASKSFPLAQALSIGVLYALAMSFGRIAGGLLLDRVWPFAVAAAITTIAAAGAFSLAQGDSGASIVLVGLMVWFIGMAQGAEADFQAFFALRSFGMRAFSTVLGLLTGVGTIGLSLGAFVYGYLFDLHGSYVLACYLGASCLMASGILVLIAGAGEQRATYTAGDQTIGPGSVQR